MATPRTTIRFGASHSGVVVRSDGKEVSLPLDPPKDHRESTYEDRKASVATKTQIAGLVCDLHGIKDPHPPKRKNPWRKTASPRSPSNP